jgi:hypothetical protein
LATHRNVEEYEQARRAISHYQRDGDWHASREIHERLTDEVPEDRLFGAVKQELRIEHRQMNGRFYWRLPSERQQRLSRVRRLSELGFA